MSNRELKSLLAASEQLPQPKRSQRLSKCSKISLTVSKKSIEQKAKMEAQVEELETLVRQLREEVKAKNEQLEEMKNKLLQLQAEAEADSESFRRQLEEAKMKAELDHFRAIEGVRKEYQVSLQREQVNVDRERERVEALTTSFATEREELKSQVIKLTEEVSRLKATKHVVFETEPSPSVATSVEADLVSIGSDVASEPASKSPPSTESLEVEVASKESQMTSEGKESESSALVATMAKLLKAQTEAIAAQTQAAAAQHLPPLKPFTGEDMQDEEKTFDRWLELFEERAKLAKWIPTQRLHQLKLLLDRTALKAFRTFAHEDREDYDRATTALRKRFKLVDIEELRGLEFHHKMQGKESIEELGMELQALGRKAFPSSYGKEFDRLLKGRFFQAIHVKWQRKLGAPKASESFQELFDRARVLEQHEKQYAESAASRSSDTSSGSVRSHQRNKGSRPSAERSSQGINEEPEKAGTYVPVCDRVCYNCKQTGHISRSCPKKGRQEAPGQGSGHVKENPNPKGSRNAAVESKEPEEPEESEKTLVAVDKLSTEQLQELLVQRQFQEEQQMLESGTNIAKANTVKAEDKRDDLKAVGPTVYLSVSVNGVSVEAMVDTGAQSSIISRSFLHQIGRHMKSQGKPLPVLEKPTARLFGKDGEGGGRELTITAQLQVEVEADGKMVSVPVFVQPQSEQNCLLGMNVLPALGLAITRANGKPLFGGNQPDAKEAKEACVRLVKSASIPSLKGCFLEVEVSNVESSISSLAGADVLFEPKGDVLESLGLCSNESLVTVQHDGHVLVPVRNADGGTAIHLEKGTEIGTVSPFVESSEGIVSYNDCLEDINSKFCVDTPDGDDVEGRGDDTTVEESLSVGEGCQLKSSICGCVGVEQTTERSEKLLASLEPPQEKLTESQQQKFRELLAEYSDVFALSDSELGCTDLAKHFIDTGDHPPFKQQPYRTPAVHREKINEMVSDMEDQGIIKPSMSPWASPVVLVPKKDNKLRFCVDYRRLNAITKKDVYPLPRIDDILESLGNAKYFSSLDLASGYWQVELDEESRQKSAFTTHRGLYEFTRMPFGLCNAPATFQRLMRVVLAGLEWNVCFVYLDDILIASRTFEEHLCHLRLVFERLRRAGLRLKPKKCFFLRLEVLYLGHIVSASGVKPDPNKVEKMTKYPVPTDVTKVRQFLGLASYYRRFIQGFARIASPLHAMTKKNVSFHWTAECEEAFGCLKDCLVKAPVLSYPCFGEGREFILETDASHVGLGAILSQEQDGQVHPIAYASRTLDSHEKNYGITELETLGLVWAVKHFRSYILGYRTTVYTDHAACTSLLNTPRPSGKLARWAMTIQEMDLVIKHKAGHANANADALSRNPSSVCTVHAQEADQSALPLDTERVEAVRDAQKSDASLVVMCEYLEKGVLPSDEKVAKKVVLESNKYEVIQGVLYFEPDCKPGHLCVVVPKSLQCTVLKEAHEGCFAGHFSFKKVYDRLRRYYWWKGMRADVHHFCRSCLVCASRKGPGRSFRPPLSPIPVGGPFHRIGVDILQLPLTVSGNRYVVCFVEYLTKWVEAFAIPDQRAETIAKLLVEHVVCRHGIPEELLSDRGANFLSEVIQSVCEILGVKKINTSGYHPQTDGLVEKFNSTLISMIAKCCEVKEHDWDEHLPHLLFAYRSSVQESTRESPFFLLYGRDPRMPTETVLSQPISPYKVDIEDYREELVKKMSFAWKTAKERIGKAQEAQKKQYDRNSKEPKLCVGDRVMVHMPGEVQGSTWKLARPFHGPYRVVTLTPTNAEVVLIDNPKEPSIFANLNRVCLCYTEMEDTSWTEPKRRRKKKGKEPKEKPTSSNQVATPRSGPTTRSMSRL